MEATDRKYTNPFCIAYIENKIYNIYDLTSKTFKCPPAEIINGQAFPAHIAPLRKTRCNTNQLQFLRKRVLKAVIKHCCAWPFVEPVDAKFHKLPDYHLVVKKPMDLQTINKRLKNYWYYDAYECIEDFKTVFDNCYKYYESTECVVLMARVVEELFLEKLKEMPLVEVEYEIPKKRRIFIINHF